MAQYGGNIPITQMTVIVNRGIIEITTNNDIMNLVYESPVYGLAGKIAAVGEEISSFELNRID